MLLPIEKGKVYCTTVEQDVLFRYGDFLGGKTNQAVLDEKLIFGTSIWCVETKCESIAMI
jgi:hypothetical protein